MEIIILLGNSRIDYSQLSLLGCRGEINTAFYIVSPSTTWSEVYFKERLEKNQVSINAEYWILTLKEQIKQKNHFYELNWLIDAGTFIPLRGTLEAKHHVKTIIKTLKDFSDKKLGVAVTYYRLNKILETNHGIENETQQEESLGEIFRNTNKHDQLIPLSSIQSHAIVSTLIPNKTKFGSLPLPLKLGYATEMAPRIKKIINQLLSKVINKFNLNLMESILNNKVIPIVSGQGPILLMQGSLVIGAIQTLNTNTSAKEWRDSVATLGFAGAQSLSSGVLIWAEVDPIIGKLVAISWVVGQSAYTAVSNSIEYLDYNLSFWERYNIFSRSFWGVQPLSQSVDKWAC